MAEAGGGSAASVPEPAAKVQLTLGKPVDFAADIPIFPPFALLCQCIFGWLLGLYFQRSRRYRSFFAVFVEPFIFKVTKKNPRGIIYND